MGKFQAYPNYVDSELDWLGNLPREWKTARAKLVFQEINDRSEDGSEQLLSVSEYYGVKPRSEIIEEGEYLSRAETLEGYKKCQPNDLVMNIMLAWKRGLAFTSFGGIVSPAYSVFRLRKPYEPSYLNYLLRTDVYTGLFKRWSTGVIDSRLRLYPEVFGALPIVIPPVSDQASIAAFLDHETAKIDRLIAKQERLIELLKEKRQAVISHAVTKGLNPDAPMQDSGVEWLGEVPAHWAVLAVKHACDRIIDCKNRTPEYFDGGEYLVVRTTNVKNGDLSEEGALFTNEENFVEWTQRGVPRPGDVMITREAPAGEACVVPEHKPLCMGQRMTLFRPASKRLLSAFLLSAIYSQYMQSQIEVTSHGSTVPHLRVPDVGNLVIALPPIREQEEIVEEISALERPFKELADRARRAIKLMQEHRSALISAAVTGKIDVRGWRAESAKSETAMPMEAEEHDEYSPTGAKA